MAQRVYGRPILTDLEMQLRAALRAETHCRYRLTGPDILPLTHEESLVVAVCTQEAVVVIDDDERPVGLQTAAGVDNAARSRRTDFLARLTADANAIDEAFRRAERS